MKYPTVDILSYFLFIVRLGILQLQRIFGAIWWWCENQPLIIAGVNEKFIV